MLATPQHTAVHRTTVESINAHFQLLGIDIHHKVAAAGEGIPAVARGIGSGHTRAMPGNTQIVKVQTLARSLLYAHTRRQSLAHKHTVGSIVGGSHSHLAGTAPAHATVGAHINRQHGILLAVAPVACFERHRAYTACAVLGHGYI